MADEKKPKKVKVKKVPKLSKVGIVKTILGAIPKALKSRKSKILKEKEKTTEFVKDKKKTVQSLQSQAAKTYDDLTPEMKKKYDALDKPTWSTAKKIKWILGGGAGAATVAGGGKLAYDVKKEMEKAKGGYVRKMKAGGSVRRMNKGGSVSRGTGAAIQGTKFKGVF